jgi:hypothetical protein
MDGGIDRYQTGILILVTSTALSTIGSNVKVGRPQERGKAFVAVITCILL